MDQACTTSGPGVLRSRTGLAILSFWALLALGWALPIPAVQRLLRRAPEHPTVSSAPPNAPAPPVRPASPRLPGAGGELEKSKGHAAKPPTVEPIQDPKHSLDHFNAALTRTAGAVAGAKGAETAVTRVLHWGDSMIDMDRIIGPLRQRLQRRYGNAGHGFVIAGKPWRWYRKDGITIFRSADVWRNLRMLAGRGGDGKLGLGCAAAEIEKGNAWVKLAFSAEAAPSEVEVYYLARPYGGDFTIAPKGGPKVRVKTRALKISSGYYRLKLAAPARSIQLRALGHVRLFGVDLRRPGPGVSWSSLPMVSTRFHHLTALDLDFWSAQIIHAAPNLLVFQFGANDTIDYGGNIEAYQRRVAEVLQRLRKPLPRTSCLVIGPMDRLKRDPKKGLHSPPVVRLVAETQRKTALDQGCAFWDGQRAMGGAGSMKTWLDRRLVLKDMVHLTPNGSREMVRILDLALEQQLKLYQSRARAPSTAGDAVQ